MDFNEIPHGVWNCSIIRDFKKADGIFNPIKMGAGKIGHFVAK
jgi:hypothetical protein